MEKTGFQIKESHFKKILAFILLCSMIVLIVQPFAYSQPPASTAAEIKKQLDEIEVKMRDLTRKMGPVQAEIDKMNRELEIAVEKYNEAVERLKSQRTRLEEIRLLAQQKQKELEQQQEIYGNRIKSLYIYGKLQYLEIVLNSSNFSDLISRVYFAILLSKHDSELVEKLLSKKTDLEKIQTELEEAIDLEQQALYQLSLRKMAMETEIKRLEDYKNGLSTEIKNLLIEQQQLLERQRELYRASTENVIYAYDLTVEPGSVVETALKYLGIPYLWGGEKPETGFDCSGLVRYVFLQHGIDLPHYSGYQFKMGNPVEADELQPGDLVFFGNPVHHVGIYISNGYFIHAPKTGDFVKITPLSSRIDFAGARRILGYMQPSAGSVF